MRCGYKYNVIWRKTSSGISSVYGINVAKFSVYMWLTVGEKGDWENIKIKRKTKRESCPEKESKSDQCSGDPRDLLLLRHKIRVMSWPHPTSVTTIMNNWMMSDYDEVEWVWIWSQEWLVDTGQHCRLSIYSLSSLVCMYLLLQLVLDTREKDKIVLGRVGPRMSLRVTVSGNQMMIQWQLWPSIETRSEDV